LERILIPQILLTRWRRLWSQKDGDGLECGIVLVALNWSVRLPMVQAKKSSVLVQRLSV